MATVLLNFALLTIVSAVVFGQDICTTAKYGTISGKLIQLKSVALRPGVRTWGVIIPEAPCKVVGILTTVCDYEQVPRVGYESRQRVRVERRGEPYGWAPVRIALYCAKGSESKAPGGVGPRILPGIPEDADSQLGPAPTLEEAAQY